MGFLIFGYLMSAFRLCFLAALFLLTPLILKAQLPGSGHMLDFDGSSHYVDLNAPLVNLSFPMSLAFWYRSGSNQVGARRFFHSHDMTGAYRGVTFQHLNGRLSLQLGNGQARNPTGRWGQWSFFSFVPGQWYHLAVVINSASSIQIYVNGNPVTMVTGNGTGVQSLYTDNSTGRIGHNYSGNNLSYLQGQMDEFSFWDKALSLTEIRNLMCAALSGNEPSLRLYYKFDSPTGNTLVNAVAGGIDGTLRNNPPRMPSSAPVGDRSNWNYNGGPAIEFSPNIDSVVANPQGSGDPGIHLYFIDTLPVPLPANPGMPGSVSNYFGVFMADPNRSYDLEYHLAPPLTTPGIYGLSWRTDNASNGWSNLPARNNPVINLSNRVAREQLVLTSDCPPYDPFPPDTAACDSLRLNLGTAFNNITWDNGSPAASRLLSNSGTYWVQATDANGCPMIDTLRVQIVNTENIDLLPEDTLVCGSGSAVLNAFGPNIEAYQWSNGSTDSATAFFTPGIKWVQVFYGGGCSVRDSVLLRLSPEIDPLEKDTFLLCENQAVPLSVSPLDFINVLWSNGSSSFSTSYNTLGQHWVRAEKEDGCVESDTFYLQPGRALDSLQLFRDTLYCVDEPFVLRSPDPSINVLWPNGSNSTFRVSRAQTIRVELNDGCQTASQFFNVEPINCACDVIMPDAFTPNGDGLNDDFGPVSRCVYLAYELEVFNRWGSLVFRSKDPQERFDGTLNGEALAQGVYVYRLQYQTERSEGRRRGAVSLLR